MKICFVTDVNDYGLGHCWWFGMISYSNSNWLREHTELLIWRLKNLFQNLLLLSLDCVMNEIRLFEIWNYYLASVSSRQKIIWTFKSLGLWANVLEWEHWLISALCYEIENCTECFIIPVTLGFLELAAKQLWSWHSKFNTIIERFCC